MALLLLFQCTNLIILEYYNVQKTEFALSKLYLRET